MAQPGIGSEQHGHIGIAGNGDSEICLLPVPGPVFLKYSALPPYDPQVFVWIRNRETGGEDDVIDLMHLAVPRSYAIRQDFVDRLSDQMNVGAIECRIEVVGHEQALAANLVSGRETAPNRRVL